MPTPVPWITVRPADLDAYVVSEQADALRDAGLGTGQDDPWTVHAPDVIARVRAEVQQPLSDQISATPNSIPPSLKWVTCYLILAAMSTRLSLVLRLTDDQKAQIERADSYLKRVSRAEVPIETPTDPLPGGTVSRAGAISVVSAGERVATRDRLRGL